MKSLGEIQGLIYQAVNDLAELDEALGVPDIGSDAQRQLEAERELLAGWLSRWRAEKLSYVAAHSDVLSKTAANGRVMAGTVSAPVMARSTGTAHQRALDSLVAAAQQLEVSAAGSPDPRQLAAETEQIALRVLRLLAPGDTARRNQVLGALGRLGAVTGRPADGGEMKTAGSMVWGIEGERMAREARDRAAWEKRQAMRKAHPAAASGPHAAHVRTIEQQNPARDQEELIASLRQSRLPVSRHPAFERRF